MGKRGAAAGEKAVLITGAAGGMGFAAAKRLLRSGYAVYGLDRRAPEPLEGLEFLPADLTDPAAVRRAAGQLSERGVRLNGIVHMAGLYDLASLVEMEEADWDRIFQVNLYAAYRVDRAFLPLLAPGARILVTTSELAPLDPLPFTGVYAVTKAAADRYALSLRMELQLLGIGVSVLRPGAVDTGLLDVSRTRLDAFCKNTTHYGVNAERFRRIVQGFESRPVSPDAVAALAYRAVIAKRPRPVYGINRQPLLSLFSALPVRWQNAAVRRILPGGRK